MNRIAFTSITRASLALCLLLLALAGCGNEPTPPIEPAPPAAPPEPVPAPAAAPTAAPVAAPEPEPTAEEVPVAEDFEAEAETKIDTKNYKAELAALDEELSAEDKLPPEAR